MKVKRFIGGMLESNGNFLYHKAGGKCLIIDPGYNYRTFTDFIEENQLKLDGILLTHHHYDHVGAVERIRKVYECPVYMHKDDCDMYKKQVDVYMNDGDVIDLEGECIEVISTPGHTKGSVCFFLPESRMMFTGDTVFDVDLGRSDLEGGSERDMEDTVVNIVNKWDNDIFIYPGHGDGCTMKKVKEVNTELKAILSGCGR